ncbi:hypothetical protein [Arthrobacter sp. N199823]|uniref:hypothetical protein n=1 Tax=Arthrobacter sp. N199823 TaxID=2058895 RepID=UPI000CE4266C|nr:hypothetical protein [Arthrobacter sp. N199823]
MKTVKQAPTSRPALSSIFLALTSVGLALSTLYFPSVTIKIVLLIIAALLLAATGASLAIVLARSQPPSDR